MIFSQHDSKTLLLIGLLAIGIAIYSLYEGSGCAGKPFVASLPADRALGVDRLVAINTTWQALSLRYLVRRESFADLIDADRRARVPGDQKGAIEPEEVWTAAVTALRIVRAGRL